MTQPNKELASIESSTVGTMESSSTTEKIEKVDSHKFDPTQNNTIPITHQKMQDNQITSKGETL
jgi:hypothetical protein